ncbi:MAG: DUF3667 domain-containing protein [Proteobacteria bacterium]|nr:DUF3667 domain-containing protein [Pseudomonadota bacterium]
MDRELDILGAASIGGWLKWRKKHTVEIGTPCANCETPVQGPYCHNCGQLAEGFHKSIGHLIVEGFESFFHFDGRLFQTLPKLVLKPGLLTREYLDGHRAAQIPPLRLFLVVLLILFFVGGLNLGGDSGNHVNIGGPGQFRDGVNVNTDGKAVRLTSEEKREIAAHFTDTKRIKDIVAKAKARQDAADAAAGKVSTAPAAPKNPKEPPNAKSATAASGKDTNNTNLVLFGKPASESSKNWFMQRVKKAQENPELFMMAMESWAHRLAFLMLPVAALWLSLLFVFQRRFYIFDHLIFSMHSLAFQGLLLSTLFLLGALSGWFWWLILLAPVHLFVHMRGTYGSAIWSTLLRMWVLFWGSLIGFSALAVGLMWLALNAMH